MSVVFGCVYFYVLEVVWYVLLKVYMVLCLLLGCVLRESLVGQLCCLCCMSGLFVMFLLLFSYDLCSRLVHTVASCVFCYYFVVCTLRIIVVLFILGEICTRCSCILVFCICGSCSSCLHLLRVLLI